jgi:hypothetical protein
MLTDTLTQLKAQLAELHQQNLRAITRKFGIEKHSTLKVWRARAYPRQRAIFVPAILSTDSVRVIETKAAIGTHEAAHAIRGRCPNREPHRKDPRQRGVSACLQCELDAWLLARQLAPFTKTMHEEAARCLESYVSD